MDAAQYDLAVFYGKGLGGLQDNKLAYAWFGVAATQGHQDAINGRDYARTLLDPDSLAEARKIARDYYERYAKPFEGIEWEDLQENPN